MQRIHHSNLSLGNQAYQGLKRIILERQIPPGGKLNEGDLANALGISRTPIREAINRLEKEVLFRSFRSVVPTSSNSRKKTCMSCFSFVKILRGWPPISPLPK